MEMSDEICLNIGAQEMDTSGYHVSDPKEIEFHTEDPDLNMGTVLQPGIDSVSSLQPPTI